MKLAIITAHAGAESIGTAVSSWGRKNVFYIDGNDAVLDNNPRIYVMDGREGMLPAYQRGLEKCANYDLLAYLHDDVIINDPSWAERVMAEFEDPKVGLVGFGGALGHGTSDLYKAPYDYHQLARQDFMSNMVDAENHGRRFHGSIDVSVLDGFALIVRREVLERAGGWPIGTPIGYVNYDYWLSCMTRRLGYRIRLVGVACQHLGGQTFVKLGIGRDEKYWTQYLESHEFIYREFSDVLPARV